MWGSLNFHFKCTIKIKIIATWRREKKNMNLKSWIFVTVEKSKRSISFQFLPHSTDSTNVKEKLSLLTMRRRQQYTSEKRIQVCFYHILPLSWVVSLVDSIILLFSVVLVCVFRLGERKKNFYFKIIIHFRTNSCFSAFFEILRLEKIVVVFFFQVFIILYFVNFCVKRNLDYSSKIS